MSSCADLAGRWCWQPSLACSSRRGEEQRPFKAAADEDRWPGLCGPRKLQEAAGAAGHRVPVGGVVQGKVLKP